MITLRELSKSDRALGAVTTDECHLIAAVLDLAARSWFVRWLLPRAYRDKALPMRMLAATFGRTPEEREPSLQQQIRIKMEADKRGR
jgi:hypothetical protein